MGSLVSAVHERELEKVRNFTNANDSNSHVDANTKNNITPLYIATKHGHDKIVKLLLNLGANVDTQYKDGKTVLHCAVTKGHTKIVKHILKHCPDVNNKSNKSCLSIAVQGCRRQYRRITGNLLQYGFTVNPEDVNDCELLHAAVKNRYLDVVEDLVKSGADVNMLSKNNDAPLHTAVQCNNEKVAILFIISGANVNAKRPDGTTALHIAAFQDNKEIVKTLLKFGADIDSRNEHGETALNVAFKRENKRIITVLLENGSDLTNLDFAMTCMMPSIKQSHIIRTFIRDYIHTLVVLEKHIIKLKTANLYVCEKYLSWSRSLSDFECEEEIRKMKSEKITMNSKVSFYDILTKSKRIIAHYANNESIVQVLNSYDYKKKFPLYANMINCHFKTGMERKELLECIEVYNSLFTNFPQLPYHCMDKIFSYLSNKDLRMIIEACKLNDVI